MLKGRSDGCKSRPVFSLFPFTPRLARSDTPNGGDFGAKSSLWWLVGSKSGKAHVVSVGKWCLWWSGGVEEAIEWV